MSEEPRTRVRLAMPELLTLAAAVRPDWNEDALRGAVVSCHQRGWPWIRTLKEVVALMCDEDGTPRDLAEAARNPLRRGAPTADVYEKGAAAARAALGRSGGRETRTLDEVAAEHYVKGLADAAGGAR